MVEKNVFVLPASVDRSDMLGRIIRFCHMLGVDKRWRVTVEPYHKTRTLSQNATLWMLYGQILERGRDVMAGWDKEDLHRFFLMSHFGSEELELYGKRYHKPLRRSSGLTTTEFADFISHIERFMAERGVSLDMPDDIRYEDEAA